MRCARHCPCAEMNAERTRDRTRQASKYDYVKVCSVSMLDLLIYVAARLSGTCFLSVLHAKHVSA